MSKKKNKKDKKEKSKKVVKANLLELIQAVNYQYERKLDSTFTEFDLSNEQFRILQILKDAPADGFSLRVIREMLPNQTSNATRLVEKLSSKKLLSKKSSRTDKRELRIKLTAQGNQILDNAQKKIDLLEAELSDSLKNKNAKLITDYLSTVSDKLSPPST